MEETLGKRIAAHRKRLGLTQDRLAELLGVTAQAVSKWENDQSCPDITMLPKLSEVFGITTDEMLGLKKEDTVHTGEVVTGENDEDEPEGVHLSGGEFEVHVDTGKRGSLQLALWLLLTGILLFGAKSGVLVPSGLYQLDLDFWDILWPSGLLVFGLFGLYHRFSALRLGCALYGGYHLMVDFRVMPNILDKDLLLPVFLLLFGLSLLLDALRKPRKGNVVVTRNGKNIRKNECTMEDEYFECSGTFGEFDHLIQLPRLHSGRAGLSFGEMTIDLSGCEEIAENCQIDLNCSFGDLELLVPRRYRVIPKSRTAFANVETKGSPAAQAEGTVYVNCNVSFGQIVLRYI